MPPPPTSLSPDLARLVEDGFEVDFAAGYLLLRNVPYVDADRQVRRGTLVSELSMAGDRTTTPQTHVAMFAGAYPCDASGRPLEAIRYYASPLDLGEGTLVQHSFSSKPVVGYYADYHEKMTTYAAIISNEAEAIDPAATARTFRVTEPTDDTSPFHYIDSATTRVGIDAVSRKLQLGRVVIVGLGGTGSYVLDLVAKTPVGCIDLFDGDTYGQHNAFRSPGAPSIAQLRARPLKAEHFRDVYSQMHRRILANGYLDASNIEEIRGADFVFICIDAGKAKRLIVAKLEEFGIPFIDVGMGVERVDDSLLGVVRVTTSTPAMRDHVHAGGRIPLDGDGRDDLYSRNIQIADLNMLNAAMAVIRWKKLFGFYKDLEGEHHSTYAVDGNHLLNEDQQSGGCGPPEENHLPDGNRA